MTILDARLNGKGVPLIQENGTHAALLPTGEFSIALDAGLPLRIEAGRASFTLPAPAAGSVQVSLVIPGDFTEEAGTNAANELLAAGDLPTAVFAANDMVAAGLLGGLDRAGVEVPGDVSIVGYDNILIAHLAHFSLTTIDQPRLEMGRLALQLLLDRRDNRRPREVRLLEPTLVVRSTTEPAR